MCTSNVGSLKASLPKNQIEHPSRSRHCLSVGSIKYQLPVIHFLLQSVQGLAVHFVPYYAHEWLSDQAVYSGYSAPVPPICGTLLPQIYRRGAFFSHLVGRRTEY